MKTARFDERLTVDAKGLYCRPGNFHVDPHGGVPRAVITHGHSDHARPGHDTALATPETIAIMEARLGEGATRRSQAAAYGEPVNIGDVTVGPVRQVAPKLVFEVAFDSVHRSKRHKSGVAMRFPRIHRIRWDKPADEADTLATLQALILDPSS